MSMTVFNEQQLYFEEKNGFNSEIIDTVKHVNLYPQEICTVVKISAVIFAFKHRYSIFFSAVVL